MSLILAGPRTRSLLSGGSYNVISLFLVVLSPAGPLGYFSRVSPLRLLRVRLLTFAPAALHVRIHSTVPSGVIVMSLFRRRALRDIPDCRCCLSSSLSSSPKSHVFDAMHAPAPGSDVNCTTRGGQLQILTRTDGLALRQTDTQTDTQMDAWTGR